MRLRSKKNRKTTCSKCDNIKERPNQGYCNNCRNEWSRMKRKRHTELTDEQKLKANARSYLNVYIKRGKVTKGICFCGANGVEAHHEDYSKPLDVVWYCRVHHLEKHKTLQCQ